jgi:Holliday junction resolvase RusA-like endonuclease
MLSFFLPMVPPTTTAQMHKVAARGGKVRFYDPPEVKEARAKLGAHLGRHAPAEPFQGPVRLVCKWCFPVVPGRQDGQYRDTKPDTENLQKLLKDVMTQLGFWGDDAQVASEIIEKFWADRPGIYVRIEALS